jgi:hypothetical protein
VAPQRAPGARTEGVLSLRSLGAGGD